MSAVLVLDRRGLEISLRAGRLRIAVPGEAARFLPCAPLRHVVVTADLALSAQVLAGLAAEGVALTIVRRRGAGVTLCAHPAGDVQLRLAQYRACTDPARTLQIARTVVRAKRAAQMRFLRHLLRARPDARRPLRAALVTLRRIDLAGASDLDTLRGMEGAAARAHYAGLRAVLPPALGFRARRRRPPPDPVNAALSLGYTLLQGRAAQAAAAAGLDPLLGFLHAPVRGRDSLACDLVEALRPGVDAAIWELFRDRRLTAKHFRGAGGACLLGKAGRAVFYPALELALRPAERRLRRHARLLRRHLAEIAL